MQSTEPDLLCSCRGHLKSSKWDSICCWNPKGSLGYAQCLPKNKDCSLSIPIVPNFRHPLGRMFNIAARGLALVLKHVRMSHFNLFLTQQCVTEFMAALSTIVADCWHGGHVRSIVCIQPDIKDMYTEIAHADIRRCPHCMYVMHGSHRTAASSANHCASTSLAEVVLSSAALRPIAGLLSAQTLIDAVVSTIVYELLPSFFNVGKSHVLQQTIGVSMGSKGGPVLAWAVCMVHEHMYAASLGADAKFIYGKRMMCGSRWQRLPLQLPCSECTGKFRFDAKICTATSVGSYCVLT
jgi:hypothetical protein